MSNRMAGSRGHMITSTGIKSNTRLIPYLSFPCPECLEESPKQWMGRRRDREAGRVFLFNEKKGRASPLSEALHEQFTFQNKKDGPFLLTLEIRTLLHQIFRRQGLPEIQHRKSAFSQGAKIILQGATKVIGFLCITFPHDPMGNKPEMIIVGLPSDTIPLSLIRRIFYNPP